MNNESLQVREIYDKLSRDNVVLNKDRRNILLYKTNLEKEDKFESFEVEVQTLTPDTM